MSLFPELDVEQPTSDSKQYQLSQSDLSYGAQLYIDYFSDIGNIEEHSKKIKLERMSNRKSELGGMSYEDTFFNDYNIHPQDMKFTIHDVSVSYKYSNEYFNRALDIVSSHTNKDSVPGKTLKWIIEEENTGKVVGFVRFASPLMNSKPRNLRLGRPPEMVTFNKHTIMGFVMIF